MSDAAYVILTKDSRSFTGNSTLDDVVLQQAGVTDLDKYTLVPGDIYIIIILILIILYFYNLFQKVFTQKIILLKDVGQIGVPLRKISSAR